MRTLLIAACCIVQPLSSAVAQTTGIRFEVTYPPSLSATPLDGRLFIMLSPDSGTEPRFAVGNLRGGPPFFGIDVDGWKAAIPVVVDNTAPGFPVASLRAVPAGRYYIQALLNVYTTFHRGDGAVIKMHMDHWEGQHWNESEGNLVSEPRAITIDPSRAATIHVELSSKLPPASLEPDTKYQKHLKIRSELLSRFWGHDMFIGAAVLLPEGYDSRPNAHYPVAYYQDHFSPSIPIFRETPPASGAKGRDSTYQAMGYSFFKEWTSGKLPRFLIVMPQDPNPFYDDGYAVNSANLGPYGDALTQELMPYVEKQFRSIGQGWARTVFGGSTGGWRTLALQVFHPDLFNGAWAFCPDPVDFRYFQLTNIYQDSNAYYPNNDWKKNPIRPLMRGTDNQVYVTQQEYSQLESVLGSHGRSGEQLDVFQAVFGPRGADGYTHLLWDKQTGAIDHSVVSYWRDHYDLRYILERDWRAIGPKLQGKLHIFIGDRDSFYLDGAVRLLQTFLESTTNPPYGGSFQWGAMQPHCYSGAPPGQNFFTYYLGPMAEQIARTAPPGSDVTSWR
jgi:putative esterase